MVAGLRQVRRIGMFVPTRSWRHLIQDNHGITPCTKTPVIYSKLGKKSFPFPSICSTVVIGRPKMEPQRIEWRDETAVKRRGKSCPPGQCTAPADSLRPLRPEANPLCIKIHGVVVVEGWWGGWDMRRHWNTDGSYNCRTFDIHCTLISRFLLSTTISLPLHIIIIYLPFKHPLNYYLFHFLPNIIIINHISPLLTSRHPFHFNTSFPPDLSSYTVSPENQNADVYTSEVCYKTILENLVGEEGGARRGNR
jgi:hypothetical protein